MLEGRFVRPVFAGQDLTIEVWRQGTHEAIARVTSDDGPVIDPALASFALVHGDPAAAAAPGQRCE